MGDDSDIENACDDELGDGESEQIITQPRSIVPLNLGDYLKTTNL